MAELVDAAGLGPVGLRLLEVRVLSPALAHSSEREQLRLPSTGSFDAMSHHHDRHDDFDWAAMADRLETDGRMALPLLDTVVGGLTLDAAGVLHVLDAGCGPGIVTCALAQRFPSASVTGLDSAGALLERLRLRAAEAGVDARVSTCEADLEHTLPPLEPADLVWASMVIHHASERRAVLQRLRDAMRPGGTLVLIEHAGPPNALRDDDPIVVSGAWERLEDATASSLTERLGFHAAAHDWASELAGAGLEDVSDRLVTIRHEPPLDADGRAWLERHVRRGIDWGKDTLDPDDAVALEALADAVAAGARTDAFAEIERRVLTCRRPG